MAEKYWSEYNDVANNTHKFEIYDDNFVGTTTEINGTVFLEYPDVSSPLTVIRGSGLRVALEASTTQDFSDLYTEQEKTIKVIYYYNTQIKFEGWLNPEGYYEDFVNDSWEVSFDCADGLGTLDNLAFVLEGVGTPITGIKTHLEIISLALQRTGLQQNINVDVNTFYTGLSTTLDILDNATANTDRYLKDDNQTPMSGEDVIKDVLETYNACITTRDGEWFIYQPNELFDNATLTYFRYDYEGTALSPTTATLDTSLSIGSDINSATIFHVNKNQSITIKPSIAALKINYKYGLVKSFNDNIYLNSAGSTTTVTEWTINSLTNLSIPSGADGVELDIVADGTGILNMTKDAVNLTAGIVTEYFLKVYPTQYLFSSTAYFIMQVTVDDGVDTYYLNEQQEWILNDATVEIKSPLITTMSETEFYSNPYSRTEISFTAQELPITGDLKMLIYTPEMASGDTIISGDSVYVYEVRISNEADSGGLLEGETHGFERSDNPSSRVADTIDVQTGDNTTDSYIGTLYKADGTTPTSTWFREGVTEALPVLSIMGNQILSMSSSPARIFSGDIFGFFDYLSVITIDGITGKYMPKSYSFNTKSAIIIASYFQIYNSTLTDVVYNYELDFGKEVVTPTIRG